MTIAEARIFLSLEIDQDPIDAFEEQLFQFKQYFTSKAIIRATFQAKLKKLDNLEKAANVMGIELPVCEKKEIHKFEATEYMLDAFQTYQKVKSALFQDINKTQSTHELKALVGNLLDVHFQYAELWPEIKEITFPVILSKENDPMELLTGLKMLKANGVETFSELAKNLTKAPQGIINESMRLFLVNQKEIEWKMLLKD